jgi:hypothetical protein
MFICIYICMYIYIYIYSIADEEAAAEVKRKQDEAAARSARKAKLNMGWITGANTPTRLFESSPQKGPCSPRNSPRNSVRYKLSSLKL